MTIIYSLVIILVFCCFPNQSAIINNKTMEANKITRITEAKYKTNFYKSIYAGKTASRIEPAKSAAGERLLPTKHEIDRHNYGTTYQISFGRETYHQI
jgi:hypothetical protein